MKLTQICGSVTSLWTLMSVCWLDGRSVGLSQFPKVAPSEHLLVSIMQETGLNMKEEGLEITRLIILNSVFFFNKRTKVMKLFKLRLKFQTLINWLINVNYYICICMCKYTSIGMIIMIPLHAILYKTNSWHFKESILGPHLSRRRKISVRKECFMDEIFSNCGLDPGPARKIRA